MEDPVPLPTEIWCKIFLYLDRKSRKNLAGTCKQFLWNSRGNVKTSGQITLNTVTLKKLSLKIASLEWNWERWHCLKSLRIPSSLWKNPYKNNIMVHLLIQL